MTSTTITSPSGSYYFSKYVVGGVTLINHSTVTGGLGVLARYSNDTVVNAGQIIGSADYGILLAAGGPVTNQTGGTITGPVYGYAAILGSGGVTTVVNQGRIIGGSNAYGYLGYGIHLKDGGSVTNLSGGMIGGGTGVKVTGAAGTVSNAGTIEGFSGVAVTLPTGYANRVVVDSGAIFLGVVSGGNLVGAPIASTLELARGTAASRLSGELGAFYNDFGSIVVDYRASWILTETNTVAAGGSVIDDGTLMVDGTLSNSGAITAGDGAAGTDGLTIEALEGGPGGAGGNGVGLTAGVLSNAGTVTGGRGGNGGTGFDGEFAGGRGGNGGAGVGPADGSLTNTGTVIGGTGGAGADGGVGGDGGIGVALVAGSLTNIHTIAGGGGGNGGVLVAAGGDGGDGGTGVYLKAGRVTNDGSITGGSGGSGGAGVTVQGTVGNGGVGVLFRAGGTLTDAGYIGGGSGAGGINDAVYFGGGASRLILDAGATFSGTVVGDTAFSNVLELASTSAVGTLSGGIGTKFQGFGTFLVDAGAAWTLTGSNSIAAGGTMINDGSLFNDGNLMVNGGATNSGEIEGGTGAVGSNGTFSDLNGSAGGAGHNGIRLTAGSLSNQGTIAGGSGGRGGLGIGSGGAGGAGGAGVYLTGGSLTNSSVIAGGAGGNGGSGSATGSNGDGGIGVLFHAGGTLIDAGSIAGGSGVLGTADAVYFGTGAAKLILGPGASFSGAVVANAAYSNVLELMSGAGTGTLSGLGTQFLHFAQATIDAGADWTLSGTSSLASGTTLTNGGTLDLVSATLIESGTLVNNGGIVLDPSTMVVGDLIGTGSVTIEAGSTLEVQGSIAATETIVFAGPNAYLHLTNPKKALGSVVSFAGTDTIDLVGVNPVSVSYAAGRLDFGGGHSFPLTTSGNNPVQSAASADGAEVSTALCFLPGTLIRTPSGEVKVENLRVGDLVVTFGGARRPIAWIGTGLVRATRGKRGPATPVIIRKGAFAPNIPNYDLRVTKGHSFLFEDVLIPVEFLVNHRTIEWDDHARDVTLYHIELETHDVLIANGAPAESYRDDGNRWLFQNANDGWSLPPQTPCAPVLTGGPFVDAVWRQLLKRSGARAALPLTGDPDLHLVINEQRLDVALRIGNEHIFQLREAPDTVRIMSRAAAPQELGLARDPRCLGIAVRRIKVRRGTKFHVTEAADALLTDGFHAYETDNDCRWTDGDAAVPAKVFAGFTDPMELVLTVTGTGHYVEEGPRLA